MDTNDKTTEYDSTDVTSVHLYERRDLIDATKLVVQAATAADGVAPLSEQFVRGLSDPLIGHTHHLILEEGKPIGLAATDGDSMELVVHPDCRRRGVGTAVFESAGGTEGVGVWAHGDLPAAQAFTSSLGLSKTRELVVMEVSGDALTKAASYSEPEGFQATDLSEAVKRFGEDEVDQAWLKANNEAFSWHPEQGGWTLSRLRRARETDWFRPQDVHFIWEKGTGELAGFHWTKRHTQELGEVYVVGLASDYRGKGLGDPLMRVGLRHMVLGGNKRVILYVEADNVPAVKAYERLGFNVTERHAVYGDA